MPDYAQNAIDIADIAPRLERSNVLVTGGTGFLGGRLVERLLTECGARPRVMLRSYGRAAALARFGLERITLIRGDLRDRQSLASAVEGCSIVFHCAVDRGDRQSNISGIEALIAACIRHKARLVHVSTFGVYEPLRDGDLDESITPVHSGIRYSDMKLDIDAKVLEAVQTGALDAVIILPTIVYGPYAKPWTLYPASQLASGTVVLPEYGGGLCNAVYVDDVCQGMLRAAVVPLARGRRYLVSGPEPVSWVAFYRSIADAIGRPGPRLASTDELKHGDANPLTAIKLLLRDPKRVTRWGPIHDLAQWAKPRLSPSGKARLKQLYGLYRRHAPPPIYTPNAQLMALFRARCRVKIDRAISDLGYRPAFDFARGMAITSEWLRWTLHPEEK
ncbi:MAG TPA: NAD-dependent epimerase/dehydratase family protein [Steroidobacteraceae bacterium]|nr:NAD-dependent epimerase/dehydratase family protein [Steroidobacteraceae bacterium]